MEKDFYKKNIQERIDDITNNLFLGGGEPQAYAIMSLMMSPYGKNFGVSDLDPDKILSDIGQQINSLRKTVRDGGIVSIRTFETMFKGIIQNHMAYACLDNDLKFCVKHYGEDDWKDIAYVFPYMNCTTAYDITFKYDK